VRDVIRVERHLDAPVASNGSPSTSQPTDPADAASFSIDQASLQALGRLADEVLPPLVARLAVSRLGELEVRHGAWHIRVRRAASGATDGAGAFAAAAGSVSDGGASADAGSSLSRPSSPAHDPAIAISPAVGWFALAPGLAVGTRLGQGDPLGWVDVLGVRQEVVAPIAGLVGRLLASPGDPVEYGQELVQLVASGAPGSARDGSSDEGAA
jgi:biotin carboxyl carrier protein